MASDRHCYYCMNIIADASAAKCPYCNSDLNLRTVNMMDLPLGSVIHPQKRYIIGRSLGRGGFGITYIAWDIFLGVRRAIKEYFPGSICTRNPDSMSIKILSHDYQSSFDENMRHFHEEAQRLEKIKHIPGVVQINDYFLDNNTAYLVMEYLDGRTLNNYMKAYNGHLGLKEGMIIILQVLKTLDEVHKRDLIHRDVSCDNIYCLQNNQIKLLDFGSARFHARQAEQIFTHSEKGIYTAPEQLLDQKQGPYTDLYAVGICIFKLLSGRLPTKNEQGIIQPIRSVQPDLPAWLDGILKKATQPSFKDRYQTAEEFIQDIRRHFPRDNTKRWVVLPVSALAVLLCGVLFLILSSPRNSGTVGPTPSLFSQLPVTIAPSVSPGLVLYKQLTGSMELLVLQEKLYALGYSDVLASGSMDDVTMEALHLFYAAANLDIQYESKLTQEQQNLLLTYPTPLPATPTASPTITPAPSISIAPSVTPRITPAPSISRTPKDTPTPAKQIATPSPSDLVTAEPKAVFASVQVNYLLDGVSIYQETVSLPAGETSSVSPSRDIQVDHPLMSSADVQVSVDDDGNPSAKSVSFYYESLAAPAGAQAEYLNGQLDIAWEESDYATAYEVTVTAQNGATQVYKITEPAIMLPDLAVGETYGIEVRALMEDTAGEAFSSPPSQQLAVETVLPAPVISTGEISTLDYTAHITWTEVDGAAAYRVAVNGQPLSEPVTPTELSLQVTPGQYLLEVTALNEMGQVISKTAGEEFSVAASQQLRTLTSVTLQMGEKSAYPIQADKSRISFHVEYKDANGEQIVRVVQEDEALVFEGLRPGAASVRIYNDYGDDQIVQVNVNLPGYLQELDTLTLRKGQTFLVQLPLSRQELPLELSWIKDGSSISLLQTEEGLLITALAPGEDQIRIRDSYGTDEAVTVQVQPILEGVSSTQITMACRTPQTVKLLTSQGEEVSVTASVSDKEALEVYIQGNEASISALKPVENGEILFTDGVDSYSVMVTAYDPLMGITANYEPVGRESLQNKALLPDSTEVYAYYQLTLGQLQSKSMVFTPYTLLGSDVDCDYQAWSLTGDDAAAGIRWLDLGANKEWTSLKPGLFVCEFIYHDAVYHCLVEVLDGFAQEPRISGDLFIGKSATLNYQLYSGGRLPLEVTVADDSVVDISYDGSTYILTGRKVGSTTLLVEHQGKRFELPVTVSRHITGVDLPDSGLKGTEGDVVEVAFRTSDDAAMEIAPQVWDESGHVEILSVDSGKAALRLISPGNGTLFINDSYGAAAGAPLAIPYAIKEQWRLSAVTGTPQEITQMQEALLAVVPTYRHRPDGVWDQATEDALLAYKANRAMGNAPWLTEEELAGLKIAAEEAKANKLTEVSSEQKRKTLSDRQDQPVQARQVASDGTYLYVLDQFGWIIKYTRSGNAVGPAMDATLPKDESAAFTALYGNGKLVLAVDSTRQLYCFGGGNGFFSDTLDSECAGAALIYLANIEQSIQSASFSDEAILLLLGDGSSEWEQIVKNKVQTVQLEKGSLLYWTRESEQEAVPVFLSDTKSQKNLLTGIEAVAADGKAVAALSGDTVYLWGEIDAALAKSLKVKSVRDLPQKIAIKAGVKEAGSGKASLSMDESNICAVLSDGSVWMGGDNSQSQLGPVASKNVFTQVMLSDTTPLLNVRQAVVLDKAVLAVTHDGQLYGWGSLYTKSPIAVPTHLLNGVSYISKLDDSSCCLVMQDGSVRLLSALQESLYIQIP